MGLAEVGRLIDEAEVFKLPEVGADIPAPQLLDLRALAQRDPEPPRFIVDDWLPEGEATLFAGHGGSGKSLIALTAAVCIALGRAFYGQRCERRRVMIWASEDGKDVLHWRLHRVCEMLGVDMASLADWLFLYDARRSGAPFYIETRDGLTPTSALDWLRGKVKVHRIGLLVLDGTSDGFAGNENNRSQVRAFIQALCRLMPLDGGVLLLHHVDAPSAYGGSSKGFSGTTAWHNSCRARWYLRPEGDGEDADPSRVLLELRKSNHGKTGTAMPLRFSESAGCFVSEVERPGSKLDRAIREADEIAAILELVRAADAAGDPIPTSKRGDRTGHEVATARGGLPASLVGKRGRTAFYAHLETLRAAGSIVPDSVTRPNRHKVEVYRVALTTDRAPAKGPLAPATERDAPATEH